MSTAPDTMLSMLNLAARFLLMQKAQARDEYIDLEKIKVFKYIQRDVDGDGQNEICFAAGIPGSINTFSEGVWLSDIVKNGDTQMLSIVELVPPNMVGFRDLQVIDINNDSMPEILSWWQVGSGAFLSFYVYQWNGKIKIPLFPEENHFAQGFVERKDLDADGFDEIIIWERIPDEGANWAPKRFYVHTYHYNGHIYERIETYSSERYYEPSSIVSRVGVGLLGLPPVYPGLRSTPVEEYRRRYNQLIQSGQMNEQFYYEITQQQRLLVREKFYKESIDVADLAIDMLVHLANPFKKAEAAAYVWNMKGVAFSELGNYAQAIYSFRQAITFWINDLYSSQAVYHLPGLQRQLAFMYARKGDFEHALVTLSDASTELATLDSADPRNQEELAQVHSAFAIIYSWLGDTSRAIPHFEKAIALDGELQRFPALAINYKELGDVQRTLGLYQDAVQAYQSALKVLDKISERDREADVYLGIGHTFVLDGQYKKGAEYLQRSLLLASVGDLHTQGVVHYLYLGDAYREMGDVQRAERFFKKALQFAEELGISETQWQAFFGLALIYQSDKRWQEAERALSDAIETIEQLRSQYLPESLKISFLGIEKTKPYKAMILLYRFLEQSGYFDGTGVAASTRSFDYVERARSRVFVEELSTTTIRADEGLPAVLIQQESRLIDELRSLQLRDRAAMSTESYAWGNEITQIESTLDQLWDNLCVIGPEGAEYVELRKATPLNFDRVRLILTNL